MAAADGSMGGHQALARLAWATQRAPVAVPSASIGPTGSRGGLNLLASGRTWRGQRRSAAKLICSRKRC